MAFPELVHVIVALVVCGVIVYLLEMIPVAPPFKIVIRVVVILALVLYLLRAFALL